MKQFFEVLNEYDSYKKLKEIISAGTQAAVGITGAAEISKAHILSALKYDLGKQIAVIVPSELEARKLRSEFEMFGDASAVQLSPADITVEDAFGESFDLHGARIEALNGIRNGATTVMSAASLMCCVMPKKDFDSSVLKLKVGSVQSDIAKVLTGMGYERTAEVCGAGQFSVRGGIADIFPPGTDAPLRVEFFDDEVDSIRLFDVKTQVSTENIDEAEIIPANADKGTGNVLEYFKADNTIFVLDEPRRVIDSASRFAQDIEEKISAAVMGGKKIKEFPVFDFDKALETMKRGTLLGMGAISCVCEGFLPQNTLDFTVKILSSYSGKTDVLAEDTLYWQKQDYRIFVMAGSSSKARGIAEIFKDNKIKYKLLKENEEVLPKTAGIYALPLSKSFEYPLCKTVFLSGTDVFTERQKRKHRSADAGKAIRSFDELAIGDYVVHISHGIGRFEELVTMTVDGSQRDYLKIAYQGADVLYVPVNQLNMLYKYSHAGDDTPAPKINRLGGTAWQNTTAKVKSSAKKLAIKLLDLYAERSRIRGHAFAKDTPWQMQFEDEFPYEETPDQLKSTDEIKRDMESERPMDRLLCGDVGFGKTEVAVRAAFKCVMDGCQCAYLVPTTILASQHFSGFVERMKSFPVSIEMLSRFRTRAQQKEILEKLKNGEIDIIIGTHRLLGDDVEFKKLGLLIVDEEQRFGVGHKEKIKNLKRGIDVLTLTATPIPRTLNMAMSGIRDMSVITMPPEDRHSVQTYVLEHSDDIIASAIRREISRSGQVYYVYNRVAGIYTKAEKIKKLLPGVNVAVAHGQMNERELEKIMLKVLSGEVQVLVCTTIIETGIDIPNVNTIIIENADCMGLSQLYQLRGRVGRSARVAYAYLTFRRDKALSEVSEKRLVAIKEFTQLGAGFKIALRDLEIRGAGDIFGPEQHGFMSSVGYDMYMRLLGEAISETKGGMQKKTESVIDISVDAGIPEDYISDTRLRLEIYREIADVESEDDKMRVIDEICDRFGDIPDKTLMLLDVSMLRVYAAEVGVRDISGDSSRIVLKIDENNAPSAEGIANLIEKHKHNIMFSAGENPYITVKIDSKSQKETINIIKNMLKDLKVHGN
ncbi:MAG: transcription-repair coupling factor [Clostridia bacterium]|nr:transcription-repair coupling factor [Clostridia bacterium]